MNGITLGVSERTLDGIGHRVDRVEMGSLYLQLHLHAQIFYFRLDFVAFALEGTKFS